MSAVVMRPGSPGPGRDRVLFQLKKEGPQTAYRMGKQLGVTTMAVRQHLSILHDEGFVNFADERHKVGRPARVWRLTTKAHDRFPDYHSDLTVGMLQAIRKTFGEEGLDRLNSERTHQQIEIYRAQMPSPGASLNKRVATLAKIRREEGYMAESRCARNGAIELIENHCSIAKAARVCPKLCGSELTLFREVLGKGVSVDRVEHLLNGDRRCTYLIHKGTGKLTSSASK